MIDLYLLNTTFDYNHQCAWLLPEERDRAGKWGNQKRARGFAWARIAVRQILSDRTGRDLSKAAFIPDEKGKLHLDGAEQYVISWTHVPGYSLVAISEQVIGVDLEFLKRKPTNYEALAARRFLKREQLAMEQLTGRKRFHYFLHRWIEKEAVLKAWGVGISYGLINVEVNRAKACDALGKQPDVSLVHLNLPGDIIGCLAVQAEQVQYQFRAFDQQAALSIVYGSNVTLIPKSTDQATIVYGLVKENQSYLAKWMPWAAGPYSIEDARVHLELAQRTRAEGLTLNYLIAVEGEIVGVIDTPGNIKRENGVYDIGYWLASSAQGNGYATEAAQLMISALRAELGAHTIVIECAEPNLPSRAIPERLGFVQQAVDHVNLCMGHPKVVYELRD